MDFVSLNFYAFLAAVFMLYYAFPLKFRWVVLLLGSLGFYFIASQDAFVIFMVMIAVSYVFGVLLDVLRNYVKVKVLTGVALFVSVILTLVPLVAVKNSKLVIDKIFHGDAARLIVPLGLSFFTLQMVAYLVDIYRGKIRAQANPLKYALFASFFPQIIQGPIPRYGQLGEQLTTGHKFDTRHFARGLGAILWGFFLKFMLADKAAVVANTVFGNVEGYAGLYFWVGIFMYAVQLYTDFMACVYLAKGSAELFGVEITDNFHQPFLSRSIKEFWGRWHITLGAWLRDYVYIPLGGNRHGKVRKYINLTVVFFISAVWHGTTELQYVVWGMMQVVYQLAGDLLKEPKAYLYNALGFEKDGASQKVVQRIGVAFWFLISLAIFRAQSLEQGLDIVKSMFTVWNPWILVDDSLFTLGLVWKEWAVLILSLLLLLKVSLTQEKMCIRDWVLRQPLVVRWALYIGTVVLIIVFGTYGFGFNAQDFIYGGF